MEVIDRSKFAEDIIAIGLGEIKEVIENSKYKMDFDVELVNDKEDSFYMTLQDVENLRLSKKIRRKLFKTMFKFKINTNGTDEVNKLALIDYYESHYDLDLFSMIDYNMGVEDVMYALALLHEVGHIHKVLSDFSKNGYLKEDLEDKIEYQYFLITSLFPNMSFQTKFDRYRLLRREKYADDFSVRVFKKYFKEIINIFN